MSKARIPDYLDKMLESARLAASYVEDHDKELFLDDKRTQQAAIMNLLIIGEVAARLIRDHPAFLARHNDIDWQGMKGMRNRIPHDYFEINLNVVWDTLTAFVPQLIEWLPRLQTAAQAQAKDQSGSGETKDSDKTKGRA